MARIQCFAAAVVLAAVFPMQHAFPGNPTDGSISLDHRTVTWAGHLTGAVSPTGIAAGMHPCDNPATHAPHQPPVTSGPLACDWFMLSVRLPAGYWTWPRDGGVVVVLDSFGENDINLAVHVRNPDGTVGARVARSSRPAGMPERAIVATPAGDYYVFAIGTTVTDTSYTGTATLIEHKPAPGVGRIFEPNPVSRSLYGIQAPDAEPARQRHIVPAADGAGLYVETWLPVAKDGHAPPAKLPTILVMTPYVSQGVEEYLDAINYFVPRGYAVAQHNVRGSGESGGCLEQTGAKQIDDGARVVEYLGRDAPWSDGTVGMYGISYDAETQISVAGLGDPAKTRYLKAIVPVASVGGQYEYNYFDGVPYLGFALVGNIDYFALVSAFPGAEPTPQQYAEKLDCQDEVMLASADQSGDMTAYYQEREYRPGAPKIRAATLMVHGHTDFNVLPLTAAGFFERLPASTPHKGIFGIWQHNFPHSHALRPEWNRTDWFPSALAWYDRYLKGFPTGVEDWPEVQVQGNDGQWRAEPDWPTTGGPVAHLALGPGGTLGVQTPAGSTSYLEVARDLSQTPVPGTIATFETSALPARLEITGQPVLDAWISLDRPDAHIVAIIETFDAEGNPIVAGTDFGMRSAQHIDPLVDNRFAQAVGKPAPVGTPIRVPIRFLPTDLVVPKGGKIRVSVSGSNWLREEPTPSGSPTTVTILHDCEHPTALRFLTARPFPDLLRVRDVRTEAMTTDARPVSDAGGLVTAAVCGKAPERMSMFGPPITYWTPIGPMPPHRPPVTRVLPRRELPATGVGDSAAGYALVVSALLVSGVLRRRPVRRP